MDSAFLFAEPNQTNRRYPMDKDTNKADGIPAETGNRINWKWVDARTLYETLGPGRHFPSWIKIHIKRYGLVEGKDYKVYFRPRGISPGVNPKEYSLSPEAASKLIEAHNSHKYIKDTQISTFIVDGQKLNVFQHNDELWFFRVDICNLLKNPKGGLSKEKTEGQMTVITILAPSIMPSTFTVFNEWGLLWFVFRSSKSEAKEISKWLVNEALPRIHKAYAVSPSMLDRFHRFIKSLCKQPKTVPPCDRPGFPLDLPEREAQDE
jgi:phage anti-repressor protein